MIGFFDLLLHSPLLSSICTVAVSDIKGSASQIQWQFREWIKQTSLTVQRVKKSLPVGVNVKDGTVGTGKKKKKRQSNYCGIIFFASALSRISSCEITSMLHHHIVLFKYTNPHKVVQPVFTRYSLLSGLWSLQTSMDPSWGKVSVEPAAGSNPCPDCQRPAVQRSHTREISVAISNTHIITHTAQLLTFWQGKGPLCKIIYCRQI